VSQSWPLNAPVAARSDVLGVWIDGVQVLYDPHRERAHVLNPTAATIWGMLAQSTTAAEVTRELSRRQSVKSDVVAADVASAVSSFAANGLLRDEATRSERDDVSERPARPVQELDRRTATLCVLDTLIAFAVHGPAVADAIDWYGAPLVVDGTPADVRSLDLTIDGVRTFPMLLNRVAADVEDSTVLHAGGVVAGDDLVVLPGTPNAGKSTLVTALVERGFGYVSDEAVGLTAGDLCAVGYPKRVTLEIGSWSLFPALVADRRSQHGAFDPSRVRWIDARNINPNALAWQAKRPRAALVVVPDFRPSADVEVERLEPITALTGLLGCTFNLGRVGSAGLETLRDLAERVPCVRLTHGDARAAADVVVSLMREHGLTPLP
jgi:hypothetical protein